MQYPLQLRFKLLAIATQVYVSDPNEQLVFYVKQKAFKLKEDITVFADEEQARPLFHIRADRVIDFSAAYHITAASGAPVGSIKREGVKSLWKARYNIAGADSTSPMTLQEENPWVRVAEAVLSEIPFVGLFAGYFLHPKYVITHANGVPVLRIEKKPSLVERRFEVHKVAEMHPHDEARAVLGALMMVLLERARG